MRIIKGTVSGNFYNAFPLSEVDEKRWMPTYNYSNCPTFPYALL
jgi:hypothetical protein